MAGLSTPSSRVATPQPSESSVTHKQSEDSGQKQSTDHRVNPRHRLSVREYPADTPTLRVRWYFSESPKRKPEILCRPGEKPRPSLPAKKFVAFSPRDSWCIEQRFQRLADPEECHEQRREQSGAAAKVDARLDGLRAGHSEAYRTQGEQLPQGTLGEVLVPVNEDYLFDVDIELRELAPAYWLGPIYEVRRGTWFYSDGSSSRPCDENLAMQLEEGYIKTKPWQNQLPVVSRSASGSRSRPTSWKPHERLPMKNAGVPDDLVTEQSTAQKEELSSDRQAQQKAQNLTHRLFGAHMNSVVTYQDATTAWILTDDFLTRMSSSVYQRFSGGGHLGGVKVVRGFVEPANNKEKKPEAGGLEQHSSDETRGRPLPSTHNDTFRTQQTNSETPAGAPEVPDAESNARRLELERRMATIVESPGLPDPAAEEEEVRKREEAEIKQDYREGSEEEQGREIDHLVFVTHGIGQRLGLKMESLSFIHDVNVFRKTLKSVYAGSQDLQALNSETEQRPKNCRIQVLPIVWRHLLDFPKPAHGAQKAEQDLSDANAAGDDQGYPSLHDITVDGVPAIRNLVEDLFLDILLYQSAYRERIADIVQKECNRVLKLFKRRNPQFKGKVSFVGHSLGSAIMFDLLCWQKDSKSIASTSHQRSNSRRASYQRAHNEKDFALDFDVEDLYCLGSPIGLFQMIKGRTIAGRHVGDALVSVEESWGSLSSSPVSAPNCQQIFNIFHPTDPVAYRIEPLISTAMKHLKPQPLPYVKRGIFGSPGIGFTGIGARVGQSVSGLWSNITTGVATTLLNRSLGLTADAQPEPGQSKKQLSMAGAMQAAGDGDSDAEKSASRIGASATEHSANKAPDLQAPASTSSGSDAETLYIGFQRHQNGDSAEGKENKNNKMEMQQAETKARQVRIEEAKVRSLNRNGRVDYNIQE